MIKTTLKIFLKKCKKKCPWSHRTEVHSSNSSPNRSCSSHYLRGTETDPEKGTVPLSPTQCSAVAVLSKSANPSANWRQ